VHVDKQLNNNKLKLKVMQQISKQTQPHANGSAAMETANHSITGANPKSLTSRKNLLMQTLAILCLSFFNLSSFAQNGEVEQILMKSLKNEISFSINIDAVGKIDWGDETISNIEGRKDKDFIYVTHSYENYSYHNIVITGTNFIFFVCSNNELVILDVSKCPLLKGMDCSSNKLDGFDVSKSPNLVNLFCNNNYLKNLDVSKCPLLGILKCYDNQLTDLDVSNCPKLIWLTCYKTNLRKLDCSNHPSLVRLECNTTALTDLNVSNCPELIRLDCYETGLTDLNVSNCPKLRDLYCYACPLEKLDCSNCPLLEDLRCFHTLLTDLDVSNCPKLRILFCLYTKLRKLDCSNCPLLEQLYCYSTPLTELDVSNCKMLEEIDCKETKLRKLDCSDCSLLRWIICTSTPLTELDVSNCKMLKELICAFTQLRRLDVSSCTSLEIISVNECKLLEYLNCDYGRVKVEKKNCYSLSVPKPKGTISVNIRNVDSGNTVVTPQGFGSGFYIEGDNFRGDKYQFMKIDRMKGIGNIEQTGNNEEGWADMVSVTPGYGYFVRYKDGYYWSYFKIYVVREIISNADGKSVIGAEIDYVL
jgi:hypothetical protein